jgi:DtxR family Mn-dependent transcriptional regulator
VIAIEAVYLLIFVGLVVLAWLFWRTDSGWYWVLRKRLLLSDRVLREDALKYLAHCELEDEPASLRGAAGSLGVGGGQTSRIVDQLVDQGLLEIGGTSFHLTADGRRYGLRMIRAHRLYETYMSEKTGFSSRELHERAEWAEHALSEADVRALDQALAYPVHDPHGDPIPAPDGSLVKPEGMINLADLPVGQRGIIVHLEDEPADVFRQIDAAGLYPGQDLKRLDGGATEVRIIAEQGEQRLSLLAAANVQVVPRRSLQEIRDAAAAESDDGLRARENLADAPTGVPCLIQEISQRISGSERRRLMDLGFLPGTEIEKEFASATNDPIAFRVRGTLIALRRDQAVHILVEAALAGHHCPVATPVAGGQP